MAVRRCCTAALPLPLTDVCAPHVPPGAAGAGHPPTPLARTSPAHPDSNWPHIGLDHRVWLEPMHLDLHRAGLVSKLTAGWP